MSVIYILFAARATPDYLFSGIIKEFLLSVVHICFWNLWSEKWSFAKKSRRRNMWVYHVKQYQHPAWQLLICHPHFQSLSIRVATSEVSPFHLPKVFQDVLSMFLLVANNRKYYIDRLKTRELSTIISRTTLVYCINVRRVRHIRIYYAAGEM